MLRQASSVASDAAAHNRPIVLGAYRELLKAMQFAFQGDRDTLEAARKKARDDFRIVRHPYEYTEVEEGVAHARGVAQILRQNVVQGSRGEQDVDKPFKLNMHDEIERGDNESVKQFKGTQRSFKSMKK